MLVCCHGNSLRYTGMNGKEIPDVLLIFTVNARGLNPKLKQIVDGYWMERVDELPVLMDKCKS